MGAGAGLGGVVVGSLIAPWVQLAVEQRRDQRRRRRELVDRWRAMVSRHHAPRCVVPVDLVDDPDFQTLRPYLSPAARSELETGAGTAAKPLVIIAGATGVAANSDLDLVTREIDRLEREWRLV